MTLEQPPEFRHDLFETVRAVEHDYMTPEVVEGLGAFMRVRAALLQAGREADLLGLARRLNAVTGRATVERIAWRDGLVRLELVAELVDGDDARAVRPRRAGRPNVRRSRAARGLRDRARGRRRSASDLHARSSS